MDAFVAGVVRAISETFHVPEPILEVGSQIVAGQEHLAVRRLFPEKQYVGIDLHPGRGVDSVENIENLDRDDGSVGTVLALNLFEHVERFWLGFKEIERVLRPDGLVVVSCPFHIHIHGYPNDYWRFTPEAFGLLLSAFPNRIIGYNGPKRRPLNVWGVAAGCEYPRITDDQHRQFCSRIEQYARCPLPWRNRLRYRLGQLLCGSRPFSTLLQANHFDTQRFDEPIAIVGKLVRPRA
jgi:SAM-dependent methyltransferase